MRCRELAHEESLRSRRVRRERSLAHLQFISAQDPKTVGRKGLFAIFSPKYPPARVSARNAKIICHLGQGTEERKEVVRNAADATRCHL